MWIFYRSTPRPQPAQRKQQEPSTLVSLYQKSHSDILLDEPDSESRIIIHCLILYWWQNQVWKAGGYLLTHTTNLDPHHEFWSQSGVLTFYSEGRPGGKKEKSTIKQHTAPQSETNQILSNRRIQRPTKEPSLLGHQHRIHSTDHELHRLLPHGQGYLRQRANSQ